MSDKSPALRILVIDDDQVDRDLVRRALKNSDIAVDVVEASTGLSGIRLAQEQPFDCVLLDYRLPDAEAIDVLKALLAGPNGGHAVLVLTGEADQGIAFRLMQAGALDYLSKAEATPSSLGRAIRYALARRKFLTSLEAAQREAEEKSRALDELNRQKNLLFSIIAHDLRNPFQVLLGASRLLGGAVAKKDMDSIVLRADGIGQAASQAHALMEGLFSWASLQMETGEVVTRDVDVGEIAREVVAGAAGAAESKRLSLTCACAGVRACAHRDMLVAVLRNLVGNAIKFTAAAGTIAIGARRRGDLVEIAVADTGVGIPKERIDELFRLDRRVTTIGTAGERGSGLGLLLCNDMVERQGGKLAVQSKVGGGTTFCIVLKAPGAGGKATVGGTSRPQDSVPAASGSSARIVSRDRIRSGAPSQLSSG